MRFQFVEESLRNLYCEATESDHMPATSLPAFFEVMAMLGSARDDRDLAALVSLGPIPFDPPADNLRSLRIDDACSLVVGLAADARGPFLRIHQVVRRD